MHPSQITLKTGAIFEGKSPSWQEGFYFGEFVFTTGMTGYVEALTDPSFSGQILVFTHPLIGNYGIPPEKLWESKSVQVAGVVVDELSPFFSHHEAEQSLLNWLKQKKIPLIAEVDTRALTKTLRNTGTCLGSIGPLNSSPSEFLPFHSNQSWMQKVSTPEVLFYGKGKKRIIVVDCGMKENILRCLLELPVEIHRVPFNYDYTQDEWDGLFISNGPGNPLEYTETISILRKALTRNKPTFGICLGTQLLAQAIGGQTYRLKYGHRGQNQPCREEKSGRCFLTSQNHGYAIDEKTLPAPWTVSFRNLNDQSIEGIEHPELPFFAVQFHPEAAPGPVDTHWLFRKFHEML
jgi:carbamoyl-phosphate synthase small subunit